MDYQKCKACDHVLRGRSDKKYCNAHCRNQFHNGLNRSYNSQMRNTERILRRNRRVLESMLSRRQAVGTKFQLAEEGFRFNFFTNMYTAANSKVYYFCYDYGIEALKNGNFALIKSEDQVEIFAQ